MKNKKFFLLLSILVIAAIAVGFGFNKILEHNMQVVEAQRIQTVKDEAAKLEKEKADEQLRIQQEKEAEEERIKEEEAKAKAEEEALQKKLEDKVKNTYFVQINGTDLLDSTQENAIKISALIGKQSLYAIKYIEDADKNIAFIEVKSDIDSKESLGFVSFEDVKSSLIDFIARPYENVDYTAFIKNESFEENQQMSVKGVYMTGHSAAGDRLDQLLTLIDETEINALVIDVKDDNGQLLFYSEAAEKMNPDANERVFIKDMPAFMAKMKEHNVYLIARIVTFKSPIYAKNNPDKAIVQKGTNKLYSDADGLIWASAHNRELWTYNVEVAKEAAKWGFNEIQFDYVRFPAIAYPEKMDYRNENDESRTEVIQSFLKYAYEELTPYKVYISADVFGWAATTIDDVGIGQHWEAVSNVVDYISPMMYPSHYGPNNYGLSVPDAFPYETINRSLKDAQSRNSNIVTPALIRPWIQDFTASWVKGYIRYGTKEVKEQIDALKANGIESYLVWNAGNVYSKEAFK